MIVRLDLHEAPGVLQHSHDTLARFESVESAQFWRHALGAVVLLALARRFLTHGACRRDHHRHGQVVPLADLEIVRVVRRRDLHRTAAERRIRVGVADDRDLDVRDGKHDRSPDEVAVALIVRVDGHGDVTQHRFGTRRRHDDRPPGLTAQRVAHVIELARRLVEFGLFVAERREAARTPVDDAVAAVHEPFLVQSHERLAHGARQLGRKCVRGA